MNPLKRNKLKYVWKKKSNKSLYCLTDHRRFWFGAPTEHAPSKRLQLFPLFFPPYSEREYNFSRHLNSGVRSTYTHSIYREKRATAGRESLQTRREISIHGIRRTCQSIFHLEQSRCTYTQTVEIKKGSARNENKSTGKYASEKCFILTRRQVEIGERFGSFSPKECAEDIYNI